MGEKTIAFVEKAYDFSLQNLALVPPYLDTAAFGADFADAHGLWTLLNTVQQLEEGVGDTEMTAGKRDEKPTAFRLRSFALQNSTRVLCCAGSWQRRTSPAGRRSMRNSRPASPSAAGREAFPNRTVPP
jgi:hypothetical protein